MDAEATLTLLTGYYPKARLALIRRWRELEEIVAAGNPRHNEEKTQQQITAQDTLQMVMMVCDSIRASDNSKLMCAQNVFKHYKMPENLLPNYTPSNGNLKPASDLLPMHNVAMSAIYFNKLLLEKGVLIEMERKSTKAPDKIKKFKSLSALGLTYGENLQSPQNPREVQPMYYSGKFAELLKVIGLK